MLNIGCSLMSYCPPAQDRLHHSAMQSLRPLLVFLIFTKLHRFVVYLCIFDIPVFLFLCFCIFCSPVLSVFPYCYIFCISLFFVFLYFFLFAYFLVFLYVLYSYIFVVLHFLYSCIFDISIFFVFLYFLCLCICCIPVS